MINKNTKAKKTNPMLPIIIVAAVIAVIGITFLILNNAQKSDPTMTAAPPPGPHAVTLMASPAKQKAETAALAYGAQVAKALKAQMAHSGN